MTRETSRIPLTVMSPGTARAITVHRYGTPGARPKAYFQAGIHADEIPGMLTLHHLTRQLDEADARGDIIGEIIVVPFANPIALNQRYEGALLGRYEFLGDANFNRNFPRLDEAIGDAVEGKLGNDADANVALIREAFLAEVAALTPRNEIEAQRKTLMGLDGDADLVFDVHCDSEAVLHLFIGTHQWPEMANLSAQMASEATMLEIDSGGGSFDEAFGRPWRTLAQRFGDSAPIPVACLSATVELRGTADVSDKLNATDADNLFCYLQRRGVVAGDPGERVCRVNGAEPLENPEDWSKLED